MWNLRQIVTYRREISFGDCDPAGIVYYPNILAWVDGAFHQHLRAFGGHAALCARLGSTGMGAVEVTSRFVQPLRDGDVLSIDITRIEWAAKTFELHSEGRTDAGLHFSAKETRGIFVARDDRLALAPTHALQEILEGGAHG